MALALGAPPRRIPMIRTTLLLAAAAVCLCLSLSGCRTKEKYSSSCKRGVSLTAPWSGLGLPTEEGRVCASDGRRMEMQYLTKHRPEWEEAYAKALASAGYEQGRCTDLS